MIETILIAILAKLNKTKVSMLQNKISKKFLVQRYMLLAHNKFDIHKKNHVPKVYHVYKHATQHGMI